MELAGLSVQSRTVVIVDAISDVRSLLNLRQIASAPDGMDAAGGQEKDVAGRHFVLRQDLRDAVLRHQADILVRGEGGLQAGNQLCSGCRVQHIPHLRLAAAAVMPEGKRIVRMHLDAEVALRVDELDEQRKLAGKQLGDFPALLRTFRHHRLEARDTGEHPALRAPDQGLADRLELIHP